MPAERERYALTDWIVEKRDNGWYFVRYRDRQTKPAWRGPYRSEASVALMIARQLCREIAQRHSHAHSEPAAPMGAVPAAQNWFRNHYECGRCGHHWTDEWSAQCDDDCPSCGARHMSPYRSDDLHASVL